MGDPEKFVAKTVRWVTNDCQTCRFRSEVDGRNCMAFPRGIPQPILDGLVTHKSPYQGDHGIRYEPKEG